MRLGSVKRGSVHGVTTGINGGKDEPLRFVQMYDRDASGRWEAEGKTFVFRSDKLRVFGKREVVVAGMAVLWPRLIVKFED